eukprot:scaffold141301_cov30-Tisochrysis_lutea.AAC.4
MPWPVPWRKLRPSDHSGARASVSSMRPDVPAGKMARASAAWPLHGTCNIGGALDVLSTCVKQVDVGGLNLTARFV